MGAASPVGILGIPGSLRQASYNRAALRAAQALLPDGATLTADRRDPAVAGRAGTDGKTENSQVSGGEP